MTTRVQSKGLLTLLFVNLNVTEVHVRDVSLFYGCRGLEWSQITSFEVSAALITPWTPQWTCLRAFREAKLSVSGVGRVSDVTDQLRPWRKALKHDKETEGMTIGHDRHFIQLINQ